MDPQELEVWETVVALNRCWTGGDTAGLREYFHESMVAITPVERKPLVGGAACVAAWTGFANTARILAWRTPEARVRVYSTSAVVTYLYEMECEMGGRRLQLAGRDMMLLIKESGRWRVVADQFSPFPARQE
jgi:ketosteroid isomerase-like protein